MIAINAINFVVMYQVWEKTKQTSITNDIAEKFKTYLTIFSLGGYSGHMNHFFEFDLSKTQTTYQISCELGTFTKDSSYSYYGLIDKTDIAKNIFRQYIDTCNDQAAFESLNSSCYGQSSCTLTWDSSWYTSSCLTSNSYTSNNKKAY